MGYLNDNLFQNIDEKFRVQGIKKYYNRTPQERHETASESGN